jgi:uncharacterized protein (TIGR00730 family)
MNAPAFSLCVYCGSRPGVDPQHAAAAQALGQWIGSRGGQLVYGGGRNGLMGLTAEATRASGGRVLGVIPHALVEREWANHDCDELLVVETMHERKRIMAERSDAFVALPGGIGTFEEFFEVWTWRQLGYHDKPVGLLNLGGYYDAMLSFLNQSVQAGFMNDWQMDLIRVHTEVQVLAEQLVQASGFSPEGISPQV